MRSCICRAIRCLSPAAGLISLRREAKRAAVVRSGVMRSGRNGWGRLLLRAFTHFRREENIELAQSPEFQDTDRSLG